MLESRSQNSASSEQDIPHSAIRIPQSRHLVLLCSVAIAVLYLWGLGDIGFLDPDEGMYAEIAREMWVTGDWIIPRFNGVPYVEKPPLIYWFTAATYALLGPSELSARLWKVVPTLGTIVMTYVLGRRLFSEAVGILSALILATTLGSFLFSRITQMDPLLVFGITMSAYAIVRVGGRSSAGADSIGTSASFLFWLGIAIGAMSKGLPGLMLPIVLLILWCAIHRKLSVGRALFSWAGVTLAALLILPWHVAAAAKVPGFLDFYLLDNQLLRFFGERGYVEDGQSLGTLAFLGITIYALFPWGPYLGAALMAHGSWLMERFRTPHSAFGSESASRLTPHASRLQFLLGWIALVVGAFSVSSFKIEYYALPAFPAVALFVAAFLASVDHAGKSGTSLKQNHPGDSLVRHQMPLRVLRGWTWVALVGGLLYTAAVAWAWWAGYFTPQNIVRALSIWATNYRVVLEQGLPLPPVSPGYYSALLLGGGLMWTAGFAAALGWLRRGQVLAATLVVALVGVGLSAMAASVLRQVESHHSLKPLATRLNGTIRAEDVLVHERGLEKGGGLLFYTGRHVLVLNGTRGDLEFGSRLPGYERTFIDTDAFRNLWASGSRVFLVTNLPEVRSAISAVSGPTPILVTSTGTRWLYSNRLP